jgi:ubiquitin C-terminal hydrolase
MDLFGIEQYQEVQCDECKTVTKKTEPLLGLVLSLPDADIQNGSNNVQLFDCFKSLRSTGLFVGDDQFFCDTCNAKKDAAWRVILQGRPQSLLISLRRTLWDKVKGLHKDSRRVEFPIELDASNYLDVGNEKSVDDDFIGCHYTLSAVVSHSGSSPFVWHYIAYARNVTGWFLFNDSCVTAVTESNVLDVEAFILLYERRTIPSIER